jgi:predicted AAA+ superfamily ATPase
LIKEGVPKKRILFYNFELPENYINKTWDQIYFEIKKKLHETEMSYIFLDEVQNIPLFEKLVDGLYASNNTDVYITGSNAFCLVVSWQHC